MKAFSERLKKGEGKKIRVFAGMDGFVDDIIHVVNKRENYREFTRIETIAEFSSRINAAAGLSANIELVPMKTKLGGNGPIFANALFELGANVTYAGCLGKPLINPVFKEFAEKCEVFSLSEPGYTDALEFDDGKLMLGKHKSLAEADWETFKQALGGVEEIAGRLNEIDLMAMNNWTMMPYMSSVLMGLIDECLPLMEHKEIKPIAFFDLADPEKREKKDILEMLKLLEKFESKFRVVLGLNEKEARQIAEVLESDNDGNYELQVNGLSEAIFGKLNIYCVVVHPVKCAAAKTAEGYFYTDGPYCEKPVLTTGAGDNFNAGFCYALTVGLTVQDALITGVSTSGFYVRNGRSPVLGELCGFVEAYNIY